MCRSPISNRSQINRSIGARYSPEAHHVCLALVCVCVCVCVRVCVCVCVIYMYILCMYNMYVYKLLIHISDTSRAHSADRGAAEEEGDGGRGAGPLRRNTETQRHTDISWPKPHDKGPKPCDTLPKPEINRPNT